jgi:hypothetical protein
LSALWAKGRSSKDQANELGCTLSFAFSQLLHVAWSAGHFLFPAIWFYFELVCGTQGTSLHCDLRNVVSYGRMGYSGVGTMTRDCRAVCRFGRLRPAGLGAASACQKLLLEISELGTEHPDYQVLVTKKQAYMYALHPSASSTNH